MYVVHNSGYQKSESAFLDPKSVEHYFYSFIHPLCIQQIFWATYIPGIRLGEQVWARPSGKPDTTSPAFMKVKIK